jgi:hypothetical protein
MDWLVSNCWDKKQLRAVGSRLLKVVPWIPSRLGQWTGIRGHQIIG